MDKKIDLSNHRCVDGAIVKLFKDYAKITFTKGEWPEVEFTWLGNVKEYNCVKFSIKVVGFKAVTTIFHNKNSRAINDTAREINHREFPNNRWIDVTWYFREQPGWITPPSPDPFDFDNASSLGFCVNGSELKEDCYIEIKNVYFSKQEHVDEKVAADDKLFEEFTASHKRGNLNGKKTLLWANSARLHSSSIESVIKEIEVYRQYSEVNGLIMKMDDNHSPIFTDTFFTPDKLNTDIVDRAIELYKNTDWGNFKDNFFLINITGMAAKRFMVDGTPKPLDWFDDNLFYNHIFPKVAYFCKALKSVGAQICFDTEAYTTEPYDYYYKYKNSGKTFCEYEEKVRQRGREFAETINENYPAAKVLMLYGPWAIGRFEKEEARYGLLPAFFDGLCQAETTVTFIDGCESGYEFTSYNTILRGLYNSKKCYKNSKFPSEYQKKIKADFGIWVRPEIMDKAVFAELLVNSLSECNEYVWIYTEDSPVDNPVVQDYVSNACREAIKKRNERH